MENLQMNPEKRTILPSVAFSGFKGRFEEPKVEEGFEDIVKIDFTVCAILCKIPAFVVCD
jgi:bifunctional polynucleotide phosphatase/kinase